MSKGWGKIMPKGTEKTGKMEEFPVSRREKKATDP
jgi:hypothetical protein